MGLNDEQLRKTHDMYISSSKFVAPGGEYIGDDQTEEAAQEHVPEGVEVTSFGGYCPVQADGYVDTLPFYFRARGEHWSLQVAADPDGDAVGAGVASVADSVRVIRGEISPEEVAPQPGFYYREFWPEGPFAAGAMSTKDAFTCIRKAIGLFRLGSQNPRSAAYFINWPGSKS